MWSEYTCFPQVDAATGMGKILFRVKIGKTGWTKSYEFKDDGILNKKDLAFLFRYIAEDLEKE